MKYRKEIDGLRALAIIAVIFFHTNFISFRGGFVGVDIFFVISGYLITSIIIAEMDQGSFSLLNFYERRARRILPALFFMMLCTLPFAWFWMLPSEFKDFSKSLIAAPLFISNVVFYLTTGYFNAISELKPLLHTWSLAVEEQYYILFPLLLMLAWKKGKKWIILLLLFAAIVSVLAAQWRSKTNPPFAFYLLQTRAFEILIGALISLYINRKPSPILLVSQSVSQSVSLAGLAMLLYAIFTFDKNTPSPSLYSLVPTIGAGLILAFANDKTFVGKFLGNKLFVAIGLISYSAYLWHQPIIAFSKLRSLFGFELVNPYLIIGLSLILAYLSWEFIEKPFRNKSTLSSKFILCFSLIGTLAFITIGSIIYFENGFRNMLDRVPPNVKWLSLGEKLNINGDICTPIPYGKSGVSVCNFGDLSSNKNIVLYGDSHAQAISEELDKLFTNLKIKGTKIIIPGCEVIPEIRTYSKKNTDLTDKCMSDFGIMQSYIKKYKAEVIVASRWSFKLFPIKGQIDDMPSKNSEGGLEDEDYREYVSVINRKISFEGRDKRIAVTHFVEGLLAATNKLYLIYPVPEISWDISRKNILYFRANGVPLSEISIPYSDFINRNKFVNSIFNKYEKNPKIISIKPEIIFCNSYIKDRCVAQYKSIPFYYDDDHLSDVGARLIAEKLIKQLK